MFIVLLKIQDFRSVVSPTYGLLIGILLHILLLLLIFAKLSIPLQTSTMEDLEFVPIDNWTEYHAQIQETEKSWNSSIHQLIRPLWPSHYRNPLAYPWDNTTCLYCDL